MTLARHHTDQRMSQIVTHSGPQIWLSGQCGTAFDNIAEQTAEALSKIDEHLASCGSDKRYLISTTIWLADIQDYDAMNAVWDAWMPEGCAPARSCGETKIGGDGYHVEIICVAAVPDPVKALT